MRQEMGADLFGSVSLATNPAMSIPKDLNHANLDISANSHLRQTDFSSNLPDCREIRVRHCQWTLLMIV